MKQKHTQKFFERWLSRHNMTVYDMVARYRIMTGKANVTMDMMLNDDTSTWAYYATIH